MSSTNPTPAIAAVFDAFQPYLLANKITIRTRPGGVVIEIRILDPTFTLPAPPGLGLIQQSTDGLLFVYADPAANLQQF
jgi:hypothetical protein